ncbi:hypothetical protein [Agreia pratensis]|uniref:Uncharacterized protein n=1 Tax=Agreia pratensis TaxID=150121 RepID=A0A1X7JEW1_9MICO|nr:hypothetical protein [Agreia pratensis]SMG26567.1 hypothetical protein SAMN06296010_1336 [Agreia pratensis]
MDALVTILFVVLIGAAVLPLLALVVYIVASAFGLGFADRVLDATMALLTAQWSIGGVLNAIVGVALIALGVWCVITVEPAVAKGLCLALIPLGIWRLVRGAHILRAARGTPK